MKKILSYSIVALLLIGGGWFWYNQTFATTEYYTKIVSKGERVSIGKGNEREQYRYKYNLPSYTEDGRAKYIDFDSFKDKPLKENAYLVLHVRKNNGVIGWEEINTKDVPSSVLNKLDK
ncbi:YxeA family protein [Enterococcus hirae]